MLGLGARGIALDDLECWQRVGAFAGGGHGAALLAGKGGGGEEGIGKREQRARRPVRRTGRAQLAGGHASAPGDDVDAGR